MIGKVVRNLFVDHIYGFRAIDSEPKHSRYRLHDTFSVLYIAVSYSILLCLSIILIRLASN